MSEHMRVYDAIAGRLSATGAPAMTDELARLAAEAQLHAQVGSVLGAARTALATRAATVPPSNTPGGASYWAGNLPTDAAVRQTVSMLGADVPLMAGGGDPRRRAAVLDTLRQTIASPEYQGMARSLAAVPGASPNGDPRQLAAQARRGMLERAARAVLAR